MIPTPVPIFTATPAPAISENATLQSAVDAAAARADALGVRVSVAILDPATGAMAAFDGDVELPIADSQLQVLNVSALVLAPSPRNRATASRLLRYLQSTASVRKPAYADGVGYATIAGRTYCAVALVDGDAAALEAVSDALIGVLGT